jgi:hypothetical protein
VKLLRCVRAFANTFTETSFPGDNSILEPPESISNSEVKQNSADDSVGFPHVKVGHRQGFILKSSFKLLFFILNLYTFTSIIKNKVRVIKTRL